MGATGRISDQLRQAIKARVPGSAISRFAAGKSELRIETIDRLAAALGLGPVAGGPYPVPRRPKRRPRAVKAPAAARQLHQVEVPTVERLGIYWRAGRSCI